MPEVRCSHKDRKGKRCEKMKYLAPHHVDNDGNALQGINTLCLDHYIPENPTTGWMISEAKRRGVFDQEHFSSIAGGSGGKDKDIGLAQSYNSKQVTYLKKVLKIQDDPKKKDKSKFTSIR